ncbi:hydroxymethylglutaryl-CoA synthase [Streptomyces sp. ISID311]|uniref:hydroxymethylglutaryl-CoA synthase family protein n=1 Tax=Streptomyces sp. ISID311 TaxID=2601673 RepID=UPI0011BD3C3D|nr:hydroxymethylglutaryl-CoA synthase [Streptomyces sp. ISID311]TXC99869.1 hydroxymethylglutaryl-CoA synthase family protein [Streptomyces sp. ISID311]
MSPIGIEDANVYLGLASVEVDSLFAARGLDPARMANLMMLRKTVALPCEDVVSYAVNAARPLLARLDATTRESIELLVVGTESGLDFSKATATWVHRLLDLPSTCRLFEVKQACYAGVAALQLATAHMAAAAPGARALVIGCDVPQLARNTMAEPSQGAGAVAMLVGPEPTLAVAEPGAAGYCSFEVSDVYRPTAQDLIWDSDLSLLSYIECLKGSYSDYLRRRPTTDFLTDFAYLAFHAPFPGAVKGAHRSLLRSLFRLSPQQIGEDFDRRVHDSLRYPAQVGNIYAGTALLALLSLIDHAKPGQESQRIGLYSYGSGSSSEFCSFLLPPAAGRQRKGSGTADLLAARVPVDIATYDELADACQDLYPGIADYHPDLGLAKQFAHDAGVVQPLVVLERIDKYQRTYAEVSGAGQ